MKLRAAKINPKRLISSAVLFSLAFSTVFVGDFITFGFFAFLPLSIILIYFRTLAGIPAQKAEMLSFLVMTFIFASVMLANPSSISSYYFSLIFSVLFLFNIPIIELLLERSETAYFCAAILLAMLPFALLAIIQGDIRSSFIFGPNVYYRIIGYFYILFLITSLLTGALTKYRFLLLAVAVTILLSTGSRGAIPVILLLTILHAKMALRHSPYGLLKIIFGLLGLFVGALYYLENFQERFWRLFYFTLENASLQTRWSFLDDAMQYIETMSFKDFLLGDGESQRVFFYYPHNIVLESFVYHGIFVASIFVIYLALFLRALSQSLYAKISNWNLILLFSPVFLGSMVSGSFFEAYTVAAVTVLVLLRSISKTSHFKSSKIDADLLNFRPRMNR